MLEILEKITELLKTIDRTAEFKKSVEVLKRANSDKAFIKKYQSFYEMFSSENARKLNIKEQAEFDKNVGDFFSDNMVQEFTSAAYLLGEIEDKIKYGWDYFVEKGKVPSASFLNGQTFQKFVEKKEMLEANEE